MDYLKNIRSIVLDIATSSDSYQSQDAITDVIGTLLSRGYKVYLISTDNSENLLKEDFLHPNLKFITSEMPPAMSDLESHPELLETATLWFTDNPLLQRWVAQGGMRQLNLNGRPAASKGAVRVANISELAILLDPTSMLLGDIVGVVDDFLKNREESPLLIGVGGPPLSEYRKFSLDLKYHLQDREHDLVELLDLTHLMVTTEEILSSGSPPRSPWVNPEAGQWVSREIFRPLRSGSQIYFEEAPEGFPEEFSNNFPLFISQKSVLIVFAELLFTPVLSEILDISVLLEVSTGETARRLFEIPDGEQFDPNFTKQYLKREGRVYRQYLRENRVEEQATVRVNANKELAFSLSERKPAALN